MIDKEVTKKSAVIVFSPLAVTFFNIPKLKEDFIPLLENSTDVHIDLKNTTNFDISGLQFIKSIQNYTILNGLNFKILNISDNVKMKLEILGVTL